MLTNSQITFALTEVGLDRRIMLDPKRRRPRVRDLIAAIRGSPIVLWLPGADQALLAQLVAQAWRHSTKDAEAARPPRLLHV